MFGRVFLAILSVISLLWLGYATYDRVSQEKQYRPEYLFGVDDEEVLILHNPEQKEFLLHHFEVVNEEICQLIGATNASKIDVLYVSKKRGQVLIVSKEAVNDKSVEDLFIDKQSIRKENNKKLMFGKLKGHFSKNAVYFSSQVFNLNQNPWKELHFDENSDASIISFRETAPSITDVYKKENGVIEYKSIVKDAIFGAKVNDKVVFASVIPASIQSYKFYETDYLRTTNPELSKSPMNNWLKYGLVHLTINGQEAIITDYIEGQEPIQVLYDFYKQQSTNSETYYFEGKKLTNLLSDSKGFYVYQLDDFVVISEHRAVCESIVGDYKLGNTIAQNPQKSEEIYGLLPQKVNYRSVSETEKQASSVYEKVLLTTVVGGGTKYSANDHQLQQNQVAQSYVVGSTVKDILLIDEHSFFVTTQDNKVLFFDKAVKKWEKTLDEPIVGDAAIIDIYANEKSQLLVATGKKVYVLDINGNEPGGFPIELDDQTCVQTPLFYRWKGNGFFILPSQNGKLIQHDNQGRELAIIKTQLTGIEQQPIVWVSANKPFIGVYDNVRFEMIQADTKKSFRIFEAKETSVAIKLPNEVKRFGLSNNQLVSYDQRGGITRYEKFTNASLLERVTNNGVSTITIKDKQQLKFFNSEGIQWANLKLPFSDVSDVQLFTTASGTTIIAGIDGLENKVHLWKTNGDLYRKNSFDGSKIVRYYAGYIFTVVDNLVVRYPL
jgi:hypothetical protein